MASQEFILIAESRPALGKAASRRLRRLEEKLPAVVYGGDTQPQHVALDHKKVLKALENEAFYSHILTLNVDNQDQKVVLKAVHRHPFKPVIMHMDFLRITGKEKITMHVPLHFKGEELCPGVKAGGVLSHQAVNVEVYCFPKDLPEFIEVDVSQLELDQAIHLSQLRISQGVELLTLSHGNDLAVVSVHMPRIVEEPEPETETLEEQEAEGTGGAAEVTDQEGTEAASEGNAEKK